ncbi:hypothetical protein QCD85_06160 [Paenibacillus sp. PsM32]|uniref:hypothetical protein n=1 Tax=Paenibacillus sp. PsM32 TaxID=3030536 RepID=UPI00263A6821|nr:hypothetical protein [Paenibacillus sp. PsM32]MDN4617674.1 hypothetical protein [Paenibacillus sp. PsM32]
MKGCTIIVLLLFLLLPAQSWAEATTPSSSSVQERMEQFNPEQMGDNLEHKGEELLGMAQSGGKLYIAIALIVFMILLTVGLFFKKVMAIAFLTLFLSVVGYCIIQYWHPLSDFVMSVLQWVFTLKGESS